MPQQQTSHRHPPFPQLKNKLTGGPKAVTASPGGGSAETPTRSARRKAAAENFWGRLVRAVPFQKLKILIVVWQILTQVRLLSCALCLACVCMCSTQILPCIFWRCWGWCVPCVSVSIFFCVLFAGGRLNLLRRRQPSGWLLCSDRRCYTHVSPNSVFRFFF